MPIRYETPAPLDAGLLDAIAGRRSNDRAAADLRAQLAYQADMARVGVAAGAQRADAGNAQFLATLTRDRLQEQQRQFDINEANQFNLIDRRAEAQNWLNRQDMSYAEQIRLQRLESEVGAIEADDTLARFEKDQLILQKRSGIDLGRKRLEDTQARRMEQIAKQEEEDTIRRNKITGLLAKGGAEAAEMIYKQYPDGTVRRLKSIDEKGVQVYDWADPPKPAKPEPLKDARGLTPQDWVKAMRDAQVRADKWIADRKKEARDAQQPEPQINREEVIGQDMRGQGFDPDINRHFGQSLLQPSDPGSRDANPRQGQAVEPPPKAVVQDRVRRINALNDQLDGLSSKVGGELKPKLGYALGLIEKFGSAAAMPADVHAEYVAILEEVGRAIEAAGNPQKPTSKFAGLPPIGSLLGK